MRRRPRATCRPLQGRAWDAVIDTSGYQPEHVGRRRARLDVGHYVFVSSVQRVSGLAGGARRRGLADLARTTRSTGRRRRRGERAAEAALPGRFATVRAGLIVGPHDNVFRLPWWVRRIAAGGTRAGARATGAAAADRSTRATSPLGCSTSPSSASPARSTAPRRSGRRRWARCSARPVDARARAGSRTSKLEAAERRAVDGAAAVAAGALRRHVAHRHRAAQAAGLRCRPVRETVADVAAWLAAGGEAELGDWRAEHRPPPMAPERERELLALGS